jgi:hypothetical protein
MSLSEITRHPTESQLGPRWWRILGWSCYLACSWTWCIGMFLPVLLLRDFGPWSFAVFAVPNVIGAAAMGWVLRRPGAAGKLKEDHERAVRLFSEVTVTFQLFGMLFFLLMMLPPTPSRGLPKTSIEWSLVGILVAMIAWMIFLSKRPLVAGVAVGTWVVSATMLTIVWLKVPSSGPATSVIESSPPVGLMMVCVFGFSLCPYLDRTFLRASQSQASNEARLSFSFGFCILFFLMILGTFGSATLFDVNGLWSVSEAAKPLALLYIIHALSQIIFTVGAHDERRTMLLTPNSNDGPFQRGHWAGLSVFFFALLIPNLARNGVVYSDLSISEITYRLFMAFYGLIFPAYVWLCMIPNWLKGPPRRWQIYVWLGACVLASPMYWLGFIERETWWLVPGVGLVLLARVLIKPRRVDAISPAV